jgi:murein L,D-transpeptidase YafK
MKTHHGQYSLYTGILSSLCLLILVYDIVYARDNLYVIEISKSKQELSVKNGDEVIKNYRVAYGKGGNEIKGQLGDKKTPIGVYKIIDFKDDSKFHFFMQLDYPNLLDAWYGYRNEVITATEFKEIATAFKNKQIPPQDTKLGGYIGIHGLGVTTEQKILIHEGNNWTEGCLALTNEQINDLRQYVSIGTKVVIRE